MIKLRIPFDWSQRTNEEACIAAARAWIAEARARWPGWETHEITVEASPSGDDRLWLWLKPREDYEMDEGL